jgi:CBS domain-containing protein
VDFGDRWVAHSVLELFREQVARYPVMLAAETEPDPRARVARGEAPALHALSVHNGTVWRWNRACYGVTDGRAHLRIEVRALPAGPSVLDQVANAALFYGLMAALPEEYGDFTARIPFEHARRNFFAAAREGLQAHFTWLDGRTVPATTLLREHLLPLAHRGLARAGIDHDDARHYLGVLEARVRSGRTGSRWMLDSLAALGEDTGRMTRERALTAAMLARQRDGEPVHRWPLARLDELEDRTVDYRTVEQFMTTDLYTVRPQDPVDLAASMMDWEHVRHVPVEDERGLLVGLVAHAALLHALDRTRETPAEPVAVADIMERAPVTVPPETPTLAALEQLLATPAGCLLVVRGGRLAGIVTERDLLRAAAHLLRTR